MLRSREFASLPDSAAPPPLPRIAVVTHARKEDLFLRLWVAHYGALFGRDALHLLKDGADWSSPAERGFGTIATVGFSGTRQERDQQIADRLSAYCNGLLAEHDFVLRCDCDEFIAPDPALGDWAAVFAECRAHGYIYALGLDVTQNPAFERPLDLSRPVLAQRRFARVTGEYCKPHLISAPVRWTSACHEIDGKPVILSRSLVMFHLASFDRALLAARLAERGDMGDASYAGHAQKRLNQFDKIAGQEAHPLDHARDALATQITRDEAGQPKQSPRFRKVFGRRWAAVELPERFAPLIPPLADAPPPKAAPRALSRLERLHALLAPARRSVICDVGASAIEDVPYREMLAAGFCDVWGFEPSEVEFDRLQQDAGPNEHYLPYALGDGGAATLHLTRHPGFTSTLVPNPDTAAFLGRWKQDLKVLSKLPITTRRLDDVTELPPFDMLSIDVQGSELAIFQHGQARLAQAIVVMTEVAAVPIYRDQPLLDDQMRALRALGFGLHKFLQFRAVPIQSALTGKLHRGSFGEQLTDGDAIFVRGLAGLEDHDSETLKHLALLADSVLGSGTLALKAVAILLDRGVVAREGALDYAAAVLQGAEAP